MSPVDQNAVPDVTLSPRDFARLAQFITDELGRQTGSAVFHKEQ
jgi:hypothetical protein